MSNEIPALYQSTRPLVNVQESKNKATIKLPSVFLTPIRLDVVRFVHTNMRKNNRQPYALSTLSGHVSSAESWGTGRAVSRIPRVSGSGTHRAGQGAFGNMCRGGRMFAPTKIWRRWHRKINKNQKRFAVAAALAATAVAPLVQARGHRVSRIAEIPLVIADESFNSVEKTKGAIELITKLGLHNDVERVKRTRHIRPGKGKWRNRRYIQRKGPLLIINGKSAHTRAFRNVPGIDIADVNSLNLLDLAPGGHLGRLCVWTESAFRRLDEIYGTYSTHKTGFNLPTSVLSNSDISRIINSDEVQTVLRPTKQRSSRRTIKKNPLTNLNQMVRLNPFYLTQKRKRLLARLPENAKKNSETNKKLRKVRRYKGPQSLVEKIIKNSN